MLSDDFSTMGFVVVEKVGIFVGDIVGKADGDIVGIYDDANDGEKDGTALVDFDRTDI